jgi:hypothetical protein
MPENNGGPMNEGKGRRRSEDRRRSRIGRAVKLPRIYHGEGRSTGVTSVALTRPGEAVA